jgi:bidirectional [NiFe] hydrogenase diaphorase subunit
MQASSSVTPVYPNTRLKPLDAALKRHQNQQDALIEVLHTAQELFGYLDREVLMFIARRLKLPPSRVYGVATFYHLFSLTPRGLHTCTVCLGTACYVRGSAALLTVLEKRSGVRAGQTSSDGHLSVTIARCLGACSLAPVIVLDGKVEGYQTPQTLLQHIEGWAGHEP